MKQIATVARFFVLATALGVIGPVTASAQMPGFPWGGMLPEGMNMEELRNMTPEQAQAMAEQMMQQMSGQLGIDPDELGNATEVEQREMLSSAAEARSGQMIQEFEQNVGMSVEEFNKLSEQERGELMMGSSRVSETVFDPLPLITAPASGFPDGSIPLPVTSNYTTELVVEEPAGRDVLLVIADVARREIVMQETRRAPFEQHLSLLDISPEPSSLIVELIDPDTHLVIQRYRPVAEAIE